MEEVQEMRTEAWATPCMPVLALEIGRRSLGERPAWMGGQARRLPIFHTGLSKRAAR